MVYEYGQVPFPLHAVEEVPQRLLSSACTTLAANVAV
jgi:hypothetical protein